MSSGPTQPEEFRLVLSPDTEAGWRTRVALRERFADSLHPRTLIDLTAIVTELVNNAVEHGPGRPVTVAEIPAGQEAARKGALGLQVVDQLTTRWGAYKGSTHVWFELPLDAGTG